MKIVLPSNYSDGGVAVEIPDVNLLDVLVPNILTSAQTGDSVITDGIENPIGSPSLESLLSRRNDPAGTSICIICEDITRSSPTDRILPVLIEKLTRAGAKPKNMSIVMALGTHRPMNSDEIRKKTGNSIPAEVGIFNSEFKDKENLVYMGDEAGYPVFLDRRVASADLRIGVGSIVPHPVAGWSGGAKIVIPGVTGEETVSGFHITACELEKNSFGEDMTISRQHMERVVKKIGLDFIVNSIYTADKRLYRVVAGDFIAAQRKGMAYSKEVYGVRASDKADIVISNSFPADSDYWQAGKAVHSGEKITKEGGEIVLVTECPEGIGPHPQLPDYYVRAISDHGRFLSQVSAGQVPDMIAASSALMKARTIIGRKELSIVTPHISSDDAKKMGMTRYDSLQQLVDRRISERPNVTISVITHGGYLLPILRNDT